MGESILFKTSYNYFDADSDHVIVTLDYSITPPWLAIDTTKKEISGKVPQNFPYQFFQFMLVGNDNNRGIDSLLSDTIRIEKPSIVNTENIPIKFSLSQNYPNPFNPSTTIKYSLPKASNVRLIVYDIMGNEVRILVDGYNSVGWKEVVWDGRNKSGEQVSSGIYICRLKAVSLENLKVYETSTKLILLK